MKLQELPQAKMERHSTDDASLETTSDKTQCTSDIAVVSLQGLLKDKREASQITPQELLKLVTETLHDHYQRLITIRNDCNSSMRLSTLSMQTRLRKSKSDLGQASEIFWRLRGGAEKTFGLSSRARIDLFGSTDPQVAMLRDYLKTQSPAAFEQLKVWETIRMSLIFRGRLLAQSYRQSLEFAERSDTQPCQITLEALQQSMSLAKNYGLDQLPAFPLREI